MNKAETNLINRLLRNQAGVVAVGACDGKGYREVNAAAKLVKAGILKVINRHSGIWYNMNGRAVHYFDITYTWA